MSLSIWCIVSVRLASPLLLRPPTRIVCFRNLLTTRHKRSVRSVLCYLSRVPGLRTCLLRKISNSEAHADMDIVAPIREKKRPKIVLYLPKGDAYKHIPRTSTVASSLLSVRSVRSSEPSDERQSKRLFYIM